MKKREAAVAVVVSPDTNEADILVVRRATFVGDPWSGHIALPGGRSESVDVSLEATARRETLEETGIDLLHSECISSLASVTPQSARAPMVTIAPFVFLYTGDRKVAMSRELAETWWVPVTELQRADAWQDSSVVMSDGSLLDVRGFLWSGHVLWGLTARVLEEFLVFWEASRRR